MRVPRVPQRLLGPIARVVSAGVAGVVVLALLGLSRPHQPHLPVVDVTTLPGPSGAATGPLGPLVQPPAGHWVQWAFAWSNSEVISGSAGAETAPTTAESMVKVWLAAEYLRLHPAPGQVRLDQIRRAVRDSDDPAAQALYTALGDDDTITAMIITCGLKKTRVVKGWWSLTEITAADAVRLGRCISDGTAAGPQWTPWLLDEMRQIRGQGAFGIRDGVTGPVAAALAYKNGFTLHRDTRTWAVNCLAVGPSWTLAVMQRYPEQVDGHPLDLGYGAQGCAQVATQLILATTATPAGASS